MVDGHGQLKYTICDVCRPCHSILSIIKPVSHQLRLIRCNYESLTDRCLDLNNRSGDFFVDDNMQRLHVRRVIKTSPKDDNCYCVCVSNCASGTVLAICS